MLTGYGMFVFAIAAPPLVSLLIERVHVFAQRVCMYANSSPNCLC
jgi:hypothetical protein